MHCDDAICNLCGDRHGRIRTGRLGRYGITCDDCEARRGSHLVETTDGYANRLVDEERALVG